MLGVNELYTFFNSNHDQLLLCISFLAPSHSLTHSLTPPLLQLRICLIAHKELAHSLYQNVSPRILSATNTTLVDTLMLS